MKRTKKLSKELELFVFLMFIEKLRKYIAEAENTQDLCTVIKAENVAKKVHSLSIQGYDTCLNGHFTGLKILQPKKFSPFGHVM